MSLTVYDDVIQGSEQWLDQRRGMVTASVVGKLLTPTLRVANNDESRSLTALLVAERITGWTDPTYVSDDMLRGTMDEPIVRDLYSQHYSAVTECGFMVRETGGVKLGYSPDGLVGDVGLIEVKSRRAKIQVQTILAGEIPASNMGQIQCGLLVSARAWCDYVSFSGGLPLWTKRIYPDPAWHDAITAAVTEFETRAAEMVATYTAAVDGLPMTERVTEMEIVV